jgi:uncharacterized protein (DUF488 family)
MIGHSTHKWERFVELLQMHEIQFLLDVRTKPQSRWSPQFNVAFLAEHLPEAGIRYSHQKVLGGKDPRPIPEIRAAIEQLLPLEKACMMCSEGDYLECHRHYLLAPVLLELQVPIIQIRPTGEAVEDTGPSAKTLKKMRQFLPNALGPAQTLLF